MIKNLKKGDVVWVNESTGKGRELKHEWYGKVMSVSSASAMVKDANPESLYFGEIFQRPLNRLEEKE